MSLVAIQWKDLDQQLFIDKGWLIKLWVSRKKKKGIWANKKKRAIFARNLLIITFNLQELEKQTIPRGGKNGLKWQYT